ncbi:MAG TPA: hypothetical protein VNT30_03100 [Stellaceae bacterium]|nr:hypothetical protein [Stellaceae bacterium]
MEAVIPVSRYLTVSLLLALAGCAPDYSPNTYSSNAVQQANKVQPATVIGFREVKISASGAVGAVAGGAVGGVLGSQAGNGSLSSALGAVGGGLVGSLVGTGIEHATDDTTGWEYIVRQPNGELLSVTQREPKPLPIGQKVLVITGPQARIIPDTTPEPTPDKPQVAPDKATAPDKAPDKPKAPDPAADPAKPSGTDAAAPAPATPAPASSDQPPAATPPADTTKPADTAKPADTTKPADAPATPSGEPPPS